VECAAERIMKSGVAKSETEERYYAFSKKNEVVKPGRCYLIIYYFKYIYYFLNKKLIGIPINCYTIMYKICFKI